MRLPIDSFLLVVKSILWGMQHPSHEISNSALETCGILMEKIGELEDEDKQNDLYTAFYMNILQVVIRLINDRDRRTRKYHSFFSPLSLHNRYLISNFFLFNSQNLICKVNF